MAADAPLAPPSNAKTDPDLADASSAQRSCVPESGYPVIRENVPRSPEPAIPAPGTMPSSPTMDTQRPNRLTQPASFSQKRQHSQSPTTPSSTQKEEKSKETLGISHAPAPAPPTPPHRDKPTFPCFPLSLPAIPLNAPTHTSRKGGVALNRPRVAVSAALCPKWEPCTPAGQHPRPLPPKIEGKKGSPRPSMGGQR